MKKFHNYSVNWIFFVDRKMPIMLIGKKKHGIVNFNNLKNNLIFFFLSWVRFEEIAETVLGRWSKPHVATLMQTALLDLKILLLNGVILLDISSNEIGAISRKMIAN